MIVPPAPNPLTPLTNAGLEPGGTADTVEAALLITPQTGKAGVVIELPSGSYGDDPYTTGEFPFVLAEEGLGDLTDPLGTGSALFRVDSNGGLGINGGIHIGLGMRKHDNPPASTVAALWADLAIDQVGVMVHNPTTTEHAGTPVSPFLAAIDVRSSPSRTLWQIEADGAVRIRRQAGKADSASVFRVRNDGDTADVFAVRADGGLTGPAAINRAPISTQGLAVTVTDVAHSTVWIGKLASQTGNLLHLFDSNGVTLFSRFNKDGYFITRKTAAPADADLAANDLAFWLDATPGATKAMFKAKDSGGTVRSGSVALA